MSDLKTIQKILKKNSSLEGKAAREKFVPGLEKAKRLLKKHGIKNRIV